MYCACSKPATPAGSTHMPTLNSIKWNWNAVTGADGYKANSTSDYSPATDVGNNTQFTQENENTGFSGIISIRGSQQDFLADDGYVFGSAAYDSYYNMINNRNYYDISPAPTNNIGDYLPAGIYLEVVGSGTGRTYFDGVPFNDVIGNSSNSATSRGGIALGRRYEGGGNPASLVSYGQFTGDIAEVIMYNRPLNNSELNQIGMYLAAKYNLNWTNL